MRARRALLPGLALGGALVFLAPPETEGFVTLGHSLGLGQRDVRLFDNFADSFANDNTTPHPQFPGYVGAELAVWKGAVEWGSTLHGDGTGDPHQPGGLGSGGANFDPSWQGNADGVGEPDDNVASAIPGGCPPLTLGFTEGSGSQGWRIRFCENVLLSLIHI